MAHIDGQQLLILLMMAYLLLFRPLRHGVGIWNDYRLVYPCSLRLARASFESVGVFGATMVGLAIGGILFPPRGMNVLTSALTIMLAGYILSEVIMRSAVRIRSIPSDPFGRKRPLLFRSRVLDQLFRQAIWSKLNDRTASVRELDAIARDPIKRAALLAEYVEGAERNGWVKIDRKIARQHEGYYWHPPLLSLVLIGLMVEYLQATVIYLQLKSYGDTSELVRRSAAVVFGAAFYPLPQLRDVPHLREVIQVAPLAMVLLFTFAHQLSRVALTLLTVVYLSISFVGLPEALAQWNAHPVVLQWKSFASVMGDPVFGGVARVFAGLASDGLTEVAIGASQFWALASPSAWLGISIVLWVPFAVKLMRHLWVSETGNLYFASRVRRPESCGAPARSDVPSSIVLGVLFDQTGWRPSPDEEAQLAAGAALSPVSSPAGSTQRPVAAPILPVTAQAA